jgi:integrase/recombinase XerD
VRRTVSDYLVDCQARGLSPKTLKDAYRFLLERVFLPWCEREGITELRTIDQKALNRLSVELQEKGPSGRPLSVFSVNSYLNPTNLFLAWAAREGEMEKVRAQTPRLPRRVLDTLTREEIDKLEGAATSERDKLIVRLLADTGLRASELLGLKVGDALQRDRQYLLKVVNAKGRRERLVPVPPADFRRLLRLARGRESDERIFRSLRRSGGGDYEPLHLAGLEQMLETLGESAGIHKRVYPHLLRHSFATWTLTRGMNPIQLGQILGHSSLRMINNVYSHLTVADAYEALMKVIASEN